MSGSSLSLWAPGLMRSLLEPQVSHSRPAAGARRPNSGSVPVSLQPAFPSRGRQRGDGKPNSAAAPNLARGAERVFSPERLLSQGLFVQLQWLVRSSIRAVGGALPIRCHRLACSQGAGGGSPWIALDVCAAADGGML